MRGSSSRPQVETSPNNHPDILPTTHFLLPREEHLAEVGSDLTIFIRIDTVVISCPEHAQAPTLRLHQGIEPLPRHASG